MALSPADRALVRALWTKLGGNVGVYATEALERTFLAFPSSRASLAQLDLSPGSAQLRARGQEVADALTLAAGQLDGPPRALPARALRLDPASFQLLSHCLLVTLARHYPGDLSPAMHAALDKFLSRVSAALASGAAEPEPAAGPAPRL